MLLHKKQVSPLLSAECRAEVERMFLLAGPLTKPELPNHRDLNESTLWAQLIVPVIGRRPREERLSVIATGNTSERPT